FAGELCRLRELTSLEIARWQRVQAIEREQIRNGSQFAVLGSGRPERTPGKITGRLDHAFGIRYRNALRAGNHDGLQSLGAHDGAQAAAASVSTGMADGRVADTGFAGRANHSRMKFRTKALGQPAGRFVCRQAPQVVGRFNPNLAVFDNQETW